MVDNFSSDLRLIVLKTILRTLLVTIPISVLCPYIFFHERSQGLEGGQAALLISFSTIILNILLSIFTLISLLISVKEIYINKLLVIIFYFGPMVTALVASCYIITLDEVITFVPLFSVIPFLVIWTVFYFIRIKPAIGGTK